MDGLLIDSEPCWEQAEIEVFGDLGLALDVEQCRKTTGLRVDAVVQYWYDRAPWSGASLAETERRIVARVGELVAGASPLPGVHELIASIRARKLPVAICSSSPSVLIRRIVMLLGLDGILAHSAEGERYAKPHPAAYLTTAEMLGVEPRRALVFEDSLNGAIAGKAAGMRVVAVPRGADATSTRFDFCDAKLGSLLEFDDATFERFSRG